MRVVTIYLMQFVAAPESAEAPYILLANRRFIHQISLDGSRQRTIVSEPNQNIYTLDYHIRYT